MESQQIEIKSVGNDLIFHVKVILPHQEYLEQKVMIHGVFNKPDASVVVQGEYSLKSLSHFIKCTPLCSNLEIYIGNDLPLIVKYDVASLGSIKLCLASLPSV